MSLSVKQVAIASNIDSKVRDLEQEPDATDLTVLVGMVDVMPRLKELMETAGPGEMDELCECFEGLYRYARILENIAEGIHSGRIKVLR